MREAKIYFARLHEFPDLWEGACARSDKIVSFDIEYAEPHIRRFVREGPLVNCWHRNESESVARWRLYVPGSEGVAIKTTIARLVLALCVGQPRELKIVPMEYRGINEPSDDAWIRSAMVFDGELGPLAGGQILNAERPIFRKNKGYAHKQEVRAVIYDPHFSADSALNAAGLYGSQPLSNECDGETDRGKAVSVDLSLLIERIVFSPGFPQWALGPVQQAVDVANIRRQVENSALLEHPGQEIIAPSVPA
jgi:hypothetical protein